MENKTLNQKTLMILAPLLKKKKMSSHKKPQKAQNLV
jgi:hypothetical protein